MFFDKFVNKTVFVSGIKKNSGKTTFLNYLSANMRDRCEFCRMTIGVDGEPLDSIFGNIKPGIYVEEGDYIVTTEQEIQKSGGDFFVYEVFPYNTVEGRLVFARAGRRARISLIGPETNNQLGIIVSAVKKRVSTIFIDGAGDRVTQISSVKDPVFFYVFWLEDINYKKNIDKIIQLIDFAGIPDKFEDITVKRIKGSITSAKISDLENGVNNLVFEDMTKIFLDIDQWRRLRKKYNVFFEKNIDLAGIVINSKNIEEEKLKVSLNKKVNMDYIVFNPYKETL